MVGNVYTLTFKDIASWPTPNFTNPVSRGWLPAFSIAWQCVSTILVFGRIHLRLRARSGSGGFGYDDAFLLIAWAFSVGFTASACISVWRNGIGRHVWDIPLTWSAKALYWAWIAQVMFLFSTAAIKVSVLLFYRRMVKDTFSRVWIYVVWVLMFITIAGVTAIVFCYGFMCVPLHTYWDIHTLLTLGQTKFQCLDGDALTIATGVITVASDFWTAALPCAMFHVHDMGMSRRQKLALDVIFCLGFIVTGVGAARTYYLWKLKHDMDISWVGYDLFASAMVECHLALVCVCLPFVRAFVRRYFPDATGQRSLPSNSDEMPARSNPSFAMTSTAGSRSSIGTGSKQRDSFVPLEKLDEQDPELGESKSGMLVREAQSGKFKPVWQNKRMSIRQSLRPQPVEFT